MQIFHPLQLPNSYQHVGHIFLTITLKIISFCSFLKNDLEEAMEQEKSEYREQLL